MKNDKMDLCKRLRDSHLALTTAAHGLRFVPFLLLLLPSTAQTFDNWTNAFRLLSAFFKSQNSDAVPVLERSLQGLPPTTEDGQPVIAQYRKYPQGKYDVGSVTTCRLLEKASTQSDTKAMVHRNLDKQVHKLILPF